MNTQELVQYGKTNGPKALLKLIMSAKKIIFHSYGRVVVPTTPEEHIKEFKYPSLEELKEHGYLTFKDPKTGELDGYTYFYKYWSTHVNLIKEIKLKEVLEEILLQSRLDELFE